MSSANKVKFVLHGSFGQEVGSEWNLSVKTAAAGLRLIEANTRKCIRFLADAKNRNVEYQILMDNKPIHSEEELSITLGKTTEIHFVPVVEGAKSGVGKILAAAAILVAVFVFQQYYAVGYLGGYAGVGSFATQGVLGATATAVGAAVSNAALMAAMSLAIGGITQIVVGTPKNDKMSDEEVQPSYIFNGPVNTTRQGNPVALCYGKVLCGSSLVTLQVSSTDIAAPVVRVDDPDASDENGFSGGGSAFTSGSANAAIITDSSFRRIGKPQQI
jgi:predicted phage tail protein